jgi:hypothetical protein
MRRFLIAICAGLAMSGGIALAQEFTARPRVPPQSVSPGSTIEQNSNSSWYKKFVAAPNKLQLVNPFAPRRYGSGEQVVVADSQGRPFAVRLFSIEF